MGFLERHEQGIIIQPGGVFRAERLEFGLNRSRVRREARKAFSSRAGFHRYSRPKSTLLVIPGRHIRQVVLGQQPLLEQQFRADQVRIPGEGRKTLVG